MKKISVLSILAVFIMLILCSCNNIKLFPEKKPKYDKVVEITSENFDEYFTISGSLEGAVKTSLHQFQTPFEQPVWLVKFPRVIFTVTPIEEDYIFENTVISINISVFQKTYTPFDPSLDLSNLRSETIVVNIDESGHGSGGIALYYGSDDGFTYQVGDISNYYIESADGTCSMPCSHQYIDGNIITPPSCRFNGEIQIVCEKCSKEKTRVQDALGHNKSEEYIIKIQDTCTNGGKREYSCTRCNQKIVESVNYFEHDFSEENATLFPATCTENAYKIFKCSRCNETKTSNEENSALDHEFLDENADIIPATCTTNSYVILSCTRCEKTMTIVQEGSALGHQEQRIDAQEPTCTESGNYEYVFCSRCNYSTYNEIAALGHNLLNVVVKESTCTESGLIRIECTRCQYTEEEETPAQHNLINCQSKKPTCTEDGWNTYVVCSLCDYTTQVIIQAKGHTLETIPGYDATCTSSGLSEGTQCKVCHLVIREQTVLPAKHKYGNWIVSKKPTSTSTGTQYRICSKCQKKETETIPKLNDVKLSIDLQVSDSIEWYFNRDPSVSYEYTPNGNTYDVTVTIKWSVSEYHMFGLSAQMEGAESYKTTCGASAGSGTRTFTFTGVNAGTTKLIVQIYPWR